MWPKFKYIIPPILSNTSLLGDRTLLILYYILNIDYLLHSCFINIYRTILKCVNPDVCDSKHIYIQECIYLIEHLQIVRVQKLVTHKMFYVLRRLCRSFQ